MIPIPFSYYADSGFDPSSLGGLSIWLDPSDSSNYTLSGTDYTALENKGDLGGTFAPSTVAKRPAQATKANGLTYMIFDGAVDTCMFSDINLDFSGTDKLTMFWAGQRTATGNGLMFELSNNSNNFTDSFIFNVSGNSEMTATLKGDIGFSQTLISTADTSPLSTDELYSVQMDKSLSTMEVYNFYKNGSVASTTTPLNSNNTNNFGNKIGYIGARGNSTSVDLDGNYYELLIFDKILTTDEITQVNNYLNNKWDLY